MAAVAIALPFLEAKPLPRTSAPKMAAKDNRSAKQETSASYTALQSALSESQRSEAGKHTIQNALTIAKEAKRKLAEDFATRDQKLAEDIQRYEEELTKADTECQAAREAHARAVARHDAHCAAFPAVEAKDGGVELLPHLLSIAKQAGVGASEEDLRNIVLSLVKAGAIKEPTSRTPAPASTAAGGYAAALDAESMAEQASIEVDKATGPKQETKPEDITVEDDDDLDPLKQQEAADAAANGPEDMELDQAAKRNAGDLVASTLEAFADLGEQPAAKKSNKQQAKQLTETEILLELVGLQKPGLQAGEVAGSTSAGLQPFAGCEGKPAASSQTGGAAAAEGQQRG